MASQITSLMIVYSTVHSGADQRKHQSAASLAFVRGIHLWRVNSPHKWPVTGKMFPFDAVIMLKATQSAYLHVHRMCVWCTLVTIYQYWTNTSSWPCSFCCWDRNLPWQWFTQWCIDQLAICLFTRRPGRRVCVICTAQMGTAVTLTPVHST